MVLISGSPSRRLSSIETLGTNWPGIALTIISSTTEHEIEIRDVTVSSTNMGNMAGFKIQFYVAISPQFRHARTYLEAKFNDVTLLDTATTELSASGVSIAGMFLTQTLCPSLYSHAPSVSVWPSVSVNPSLTPSEIPSFESSSSASVELLIFFGPSGSRRELSDFTGKVIESEWPEICRSRIPVPQGYSIECDHVHAEGSGDSDVKLLFDVRTVPSLPGLDSYIIESLNDASVHHDVVSAIAATGLPVNDFSLALPESFTEPLANALPTLSPTVQKITSKADLSTESTVSTPASTTKTLTTSSASFNVFFKLSSDSSRKLRGRNRSVTRLTMTQKSHLCEEVVKSLHYPGRVDVSCVVSKQSFMDSEKFEVSMDLSVGSTNPHINEAFTNHVITWLNKKEEKDHILKKLIDDGVPVIGMAVDTVAPPTNQPSKGPSPSENQVPHIVKRARPMDGRTLQNIEIQSQADALKVTPRTVSDDHVKAKSTPQTAGGTTKLMPLLDDNAFKVETELDGNVNVKGNMFNVKAKTPIRINSLSVTATNNERVTVEVWTRSGKFQDAYDQPKDWVLVHKETFQGLGTSKLITLSPFKCPIFLPAGASQAFYVKTNENHLISTPADATTSSRVGDDNISVWRGLSLMDDFSGLEEKNRWNGAVSYIPSTEAPACAEQNRA